MKDLADLDCRVTATPKMLGQHYRVLQKGARWRDIIHDARRIGAFAAKERRARSVADWIIAKRAVESHTARCQPVDIRRLDDRMTVAAEAIVEIVGDDQQHIELLRFGAA